jgi:hypothetical protein
MPLHVNSQLDKFDNYVYYINTMPRPHKDKRLLMNQPLRIMLTAEQKDLIEQAAKAQSLDTSAWARPILMRAAQEITLSSARDPRDNPSASEMK